MTRGPGATNAAHGVHIAEHDSTPMILFIGQVERGMLGRGAFQEMDYRAFFGSTAKWVTEIEDAARIPEIVQRAFHVAMQGRPGPVVIALPEDVLTEIAERRRRRSASSRRRSGPASRKWPNCRKCSGRRSARSSFSAAAAGASAPARALQRFAERFDLPVATSFRRATLFDGEHPNYAGEIGIGPNPKLKARIEEADLVLLLGGRMSEMSSQSYTLFDIPTPRQKLVHVHADALEIGRVYHPSLGIVATPPAFCAALEGLQPPNAIRWSAETQQARADYLALDRQSAPPMPGRVQLGEIMLWLRARAPDAIITNGAGNYAIWPGRFLRYRRFDSAARADLGLDGLWRADRGRRQAAAAGADGDRLRRRRLFPDERPGIRHRRAI